MTIEGIRLKLHKSYIRLTFKVRRKKLRNENFTIISNNCWAGFIYQSYGLEYESPTIGLYIMPCDYLKFISNLKHYIEEERLIFINPKDSKYYNHLLNNESSLGKFPIGILGDVEIMFLHYSSEGDALEKWERRSKRINWNKILYKFNNQNGCTNQNIADFFALPLKNKICFSTKKSPNCIWVKNAKKFESIPASYEPFGKSKYINMNEVLNNL